MSKKHSIFFFLLRFVLPFQMLGRIFTDNSSTPSRRVRAYKGCLSHEYSSSFRQQQDRRRSCSTCRRRDSDSDGSKWLSRTTVGHCDEGNLLQIESRVKSCETKFVRQFVHRQRVVENARGGSSRILRFWSVSGKIRDDIVRNQVHEERWKEHLEYYTDTAKESRWKTNSIHMSTYFLVQGRTRLCSISMNGFDKVKEKIDNI